MASSAGEADISGFWTVRRTAAFLGRRRSQGKRPPPPLLVFTDPDRTPDPVALALSLPRGAGLVYRAFGAANRLEVARALGAVARRRGLVLLVGADPDLAARVGAAGLHLPERLAGRAWRLRRPGWILTAAAHSPRAARRPGIDAFILSAVFPSASRSAGPPLGALRFAQRVRTAAAPAYALGGVNDQTAGRLRMTGAAGLAGVGFSQTPSTGSQADALRT
ncbi:MAG: thiamine phosphate synthase [Phenylobacterium sp.]|jgi:thiamine-phosphate pyrophosphorylase|uniref:thiamine phosphate synthase n=1 Tax=Phenylobacterium sp. TaxID=1871053 RepID=UPI0025DD0F2E|nr:thiamine phosphate synthase [Phenylobacterium sp.]MCA6298302.1 thiamine phosphate synthase [Phenylobacterium sp.]